MKTKVLALISTLAIGSALAGCGSTSNTANTPAKPVYNSVIRLDSATPDTINPVTTQSMSGFDINNMIYDSLVNISPHLKVIPDLASSWKASKGGTVYTFTLNPKAKWWNGRPVSAQDVAWTYTFDSNPNSGYAGSASDAAIIKQVKALSAHTVQFTLKHPDGSFLANDCSQNTADWILPSFLLKNLPVAQVQHSKYLNNIKDIVGSGPFKPVNYTANVGMKFVANPNYFLGTPKVKYLQYEFIAKNSTITADLMRNKLDVVPPVPGVPLSGQQQLLSSPSAKSYYNFSKGINMMYWYLVYNFKTYPQFQNRYVRYAIADAINRQGIVNGILKGDGILANGIVPPISWAYDKNLKNVFPYDPTKALAYLKKAGYHKNSQGLMVNNQGQELKFSLLIQSGSTTFSNIAAAIQQQLKTVGISVSITAQQFNTFVQNASTGKYQMYFGGWGLGADPDQQTIYASNQTPPVGQNSGYYNSKTVDRLIKEEQNSTNQAYRTKVFHQMQRAMVKNPPGVFLYYPDNYIAVSKRMHGYVFNPAMDFFEPQNWYVTAN